ncbi:PilZ domain-containing protein [Leptospira congkakensis]|uniref:PilZ domain-containing protein n=1 Tax=Leptospira congkakensis TaxID=2484932 RepID=A0A4Z1AD58_9LEPT|nr:PilZ domain-containing protein [Leptospira congkakensis]TGL87754.1 PilZ domain-containing protein [Leptospira congkakensis]TGL89630.1 PilZ domain-containing protein [Leptospira congkakensis]TGL95904.1 PilZ domain-containing protein [Leptospira congkakensis]
MAIGRTDSMQELITILESLFEETIIGSDVNIVKHLFYYLKADNREFEFIYEEHTLVAAVEEIEAHTVTLMIPDLVEEGSRRARVRFEVMNINYQFEVVILDIQKEKTVIKTPTELQSYQLRTNRRIPVDDLFMNFIILFRSLTGGSREVGKNLYAESRFPHLMKEVRKDRPDSKLINVMLTEAIERISKDYKIHFFQPDEKLNEYEDFVKKTILRTGKSVYIPDCNRISSYINDPGDEVLFNYYNEHKEMAKEFGEEFALDFFESMRKYESRDFYVSYIITPIRLYEDVVGFIKVHSTAMDRFTISQNQAVYIFELAEIISYVFTKIAIQHGSYETMQSTTKVVDISLDGLLFEIYDKRLFQYLKRHNIIKMFIPLSKDRTMIIRGEIIRFLDRGDHYHLGVNYFSSAPDDMLYLESYLFEKSMKILSE